jgi:hypothetical protein
LAALFLSAMPAGAAELPVDYLEGSWVRITAAGDLSGAIDCDDAVPLMRLPAGIGHARGVLTFVRSESGWSVLWQRHDRFPDIAVDLIALEGRLDSGSPYIVENFPVVTFRRNSFRAELRLTGIAGSSAPVYLVAEEADTATPNALYTSYYRKCPE